MPSDSVWRSRSRSDNARLPFLASSFRRFAVVCQTIQNSFGAFVPARLLPSRKTDLFRYDYDFVFYVKNGTFDESRFIRRKM
jgi:hypothetical protein